MKSSFKVARSLLACVALAAPLALGCTVTVKTQTKFTASDPTHADPIFVKQSNAWTGQAIEIENKNGSITVNADPSATAVRVEAVFFAFADVKADADQAVADVETTYGIDQTQNIYVHCTVASKQYGSAANGTTGCDLTVTVPVGSMAMGVPLKITSHNGPVTLNGGGGIFAAQNQQIEVLSDNGSVTGNDIVGGARVHTDNGEANAKVTPTVGSNIECSSGNGDVTLGLPTNFAADHLTIHAGGSGKVVSAFTDISPTSVSRGTVGAGASSVTATTELGDVNLQSF